jgi:hypothetical protein
MLGPAQRPAFSPSRPRPRLPPVRARSLIAALAGTAAVATAIPSPAPAQGLTGIVGQMTCVAPTDAAGLDAMLTRAGSPLAGEGAAFVSEGLAASVDPRALVAIAAHETMLETYLPSQAIRNPFGLGPGMTFARESDAIALAARTLGDGYLPEGRDTLATIGAKWAPLGAANDPAGLNANWTAGVGAYYAALGGDPTLPVRSGTQASGPACAGGSGAAALSPLPPAEPSGPPIVTAWGGAAPRGEGEPAVIEGFVFPLALPRGAPALYGDSFREPGPVDCDGARLQCAVTIATSPGAHAVAVAAGTLRGATPAEREEGIAFWLEAAGGDRVGYGPLVSYTPGVGEGAPVTAGQSLGIDSGLLRLAWTRDGRHMDPFPLLEATRPPAPAP